MKVMLKTVSALILIFILTVFLSCKLQDITGGVQDNSYSGVPPFRTFREIPGITEEEINAILDLQKQNRTFIFGKALSTEGFLNENGEIGGYVTLFCSWLSELFGIQIEIEGLSWGELIPKLNSGEIDLTDDLRATEERLRLFHMTPTIVVHPVKAMRIRNSPSLAEIAASRPPRYVFENGAAVGRDVIAVLESGTYEALFSNDYDAIYNMLKNDEADAYICVSVSESVFDKYLDVVAEDFFPLVFNKVSLAASKPELAPVISAVAKAQQNGVTPYLNYLYALGYRDYMKNKLFTYLNEEEREYLNSKSIINVAANPDNYPVSFYNSRENEWQGIFYDLLGEISSLTGVEFITVNDENASWLEIQEKITNKEAAFLPHIIRTREREDVYIWSQEVMPPDYYALISKLDYRNITINEVLNIKVGLAKNTAYTEIFHQWFPDHPLAVEYESIDEAFNALQNGEVDMVMATQRRLLLLTHYQELAGYKSNIIFDQPIETRFGFSRDETVLCSIINKALNIIDTKGISEQWLRRTYDYRVKVVEAQRPWFIGATSLVFIVLVLILILFLRNRSEGKRLENQVLIRTAELKAVIDNYKGVIWSVDTKRNVSTFGGQYLKTLGIAPSFLAGKNLEMARAKNRHLDILENVEKTFSEGNQDWISEIDGSIFRSNTSPLYDASGNVAGVVGSTDDVTELFNLQKSLEAAVETAHSASNAKSRFIANMSHEMRTPMNVIVGLTDLMLEEGGIPVHTRKELRKINTAGNTLMELINDVLDISKIEAGKLELMPVQYDVASNINDIITLNMIRIEEKPIKFKLDISENLPSILFGDDLRIKQILNNLLSNAFKYTHEGTITLGIDCKRDNDDVWINFHIEDTGIGIRKEDLIKIFSDYNQVDTRANREIEGTGLGLSITNKLVELMDGEITVESEYGKGTVFHVRIRQGFVNDTPIGKKTVENLRSFNYSDKRKLLHEKLVRPNLNYARVLLVDDLPTNLDVAAGMLRKYKMHVDCVTNGQDAVDRISAGEPVYDAVFMDHMMPGMDGMEATKEIRNSGTIYAKNIPIIALTANAVAGNEQIFLENGFNAFLPKPFNVMLLDSVVQRWVRDKSRE